MRVIAVIALKKVGLKTPARRARIQTVSRQNIRDAMIQVLQMGLNVITIENDQFAHEKIGFLQAWSAHHSSANDDGSYARNFQVKVGNPSVNYTIVEGDVSLSGGAALQDQDTPWFSATVAHAGWLDTESKNRAGYRVIIESTDQAWAHNVRQHLLRAQLDASKAAAVASAVVANAPNTSTLFGTPLGQGTVAGKPNSASLHAQAGVPSSTGTTAQSAAGVNSTVASSTSTTTALIYRDSLSN